MHRCGTESVEKSAVLSQWEGVHCAVARTRWFCCLNRRCGSMTNLTFIYPLANSVFASISSTSIPTTLSLDIIHHGSSNTPQHVCVLFTHNSSPPPFPITLTHIPSLRLFSRPILIFPILHPYTCLFWPRCLLFIK